MIKIGNKVYGPNKEVAPRNTSTIAPPPAVDSKAWRDFSSMLGHELKGVKINGTHMQAVKDQFERTNNIAFYEDLDELVQDWEQKGWFVEKPNFVPGLGPSVKSMGERPNWRPEATAVPINTGENRRHVISASTLGRAIQKYDSNKDSINAFLERWQGEKATTTKKARMNAWDLINSNPNNLWPGEEANNKAAGFIRGPLKTMRDQLMKQDLAKGVGPDQILKFKADLNKPHPFTGSTKKGDSEATGRERWFEMAKVAGAMMDSLVEKKYFAQVKAQGGDAAVAQAKAEAAQYWAQFKPDPVDPDQPVLSETERLRAGLPLQVERNPAVEATLPTELVAPTPDQLKDNWPYISPEELAGLAFELEMNADLDLPDTVEITLDDGDQTERRQVAMTPEYYQQLNGIYLEIREVADSTKNHINPDLFAPGGVMDRYMALNLRQLIEQPQVAGNNNIIEDDGPDAGHGDDMNLEGEKRDDMDQDPPAPGLDDNTPMEEEKQQQGQNQGQNGPPDNQQAMAMQDDDLDLENPLGKRPRPFQDQAQDPETVAPPDDKRAKYAHEGENPGSLQNQPPPPLAINDLIQDNDVPMSMVTDAPATKTTSMRDAWKALNEKKSSSREFRPDSTGQKAGIKESHSSSQAQGLGV